MRQSKPKSTLLVDKTQGLKTTKQTKPRPFAYVAPYPITQANGFNLYMGGTIYSIRLYFSYIILITLSPPLFLIFLESWGFGHRLGNRGTSFLHLHACYGIYGYVGGDKLVWYAREDILACYGTLKEDLSKIYWYLSMGHKLRIDNSSIIHSESTVTSISLGTIEKE